MRDFTIEEIKELCQTAKLPIGIPFIDDRLEEYRVKYNGNHQYYAVLKAVTERLQPSIIVEVGGWTGTSAACFAAGFPGATVITIDHHSDPGDDINKKRMEEAVAAFPNIQYFQGCSTEKVHAEKAGTICVYEDIVKFLDGRPIDILFIDGWHQSDMAQADYDTYTPLMSKPGLVIGDDITGGNSSGHIGMLDFYNGLPGAQEDRHLDGNIHPGYPVFFLKHG